MRNLATDLTNIRLGYTAQTAVSQRAAQILAVEEDSEQAYELALEIDQLQEAEADNRGFGLRTGKADQEEWLLGRHVWAGMAIHAFRLERAFWMDRGATVEQAAAEARRIFREDFIGAADVSCAARFTDFLKMAAE